MQEAKSKEEFITEMEKKGYTVSWKDSRKYIVFTNQDGKKVRNRNLQKTYNMPVGKDELIQFFEKKLLARKPEHPARHSRR